MPPEAFYDDWADLYDQMIDWDRRLAREVPALTALLRAARANKVLDVACGTGRHAVALAGEGFDMTGADASEAMVQSAERQAGAQGVRWMRWSMGEPPPADLLAAAPFDALTCLGNSFPHLVADADVAAALANFRRLLAPGGRLMLGFKALEELRGSPKPFLPLVRRRDRGAELLFVRFYDFRDDAPPATADFHLLILAPDHPRLAEGGGVHHAVNRLRSWRPAELAEAVGRAGFEQIRIARDLAGTPWQPGEGEDIFVSAVRAAREEE